MARLEVLVRESGLPPDAIRRQIASAFDVVVQLERLSNGARVVSQVAEVLKQVSPTTNQVRVRPLFAREFGHHSPLLPTGSLPSFATALIKEGYLDPNVFFADFNEGDSENDSSAKREQLPALQHAVAHREAITV